MSSASNDRRRSRAPTVQERFAADRRRYERVVVGRYGGTLTYEDAEDIVSEAIVNDAHKCPSDAREDGRAWFSRVVLNRAEDYRRARDGRPRATRGRGRHGEPQDTTTRPPRTVSIEALPEHQHPVVATAGPGTPVSIEDTLDAEYDRAHAAEVVASALSMLEPEDEQLLRARFLAGAGSRKRQEVADELGLSLTKYEVRFTRAWAAFTEAVAMSRPTAQCARTRQIIGQIDDGHATSDDQVRVDAHLAGCAHCRAWSATVHNALGLPAAALAGAAVTAAPAAGGHAAGHAAGHGVAAISTKAAAIGVSALVVAGGIVAYGLAHRDHGAPPATVVAPVVRTHPAAVTPATTPSAATPHTAPKKKKAKKKKATPRRTTSTPVAPVATPEPEPQAPAPEPTPAPEPAPSRSGSFSGEFAP